MKKFLTLIIIAAAAFVATPNAEARPYHAGHTYVSGRSSCGCPVYSQRFIAYYDQCGRPIYSVRRLPITHRCRPKAYYHPQPRRVSHGVHYSNNRGVYFNSHPSSRYYSSRSKCR
ncbi:hypothetical protein [Haloferula sp.]|uniref:hypothetical protein n=1 Tax=Haloferula sp. TaxID=2497595 RepID=UPI003C72B897